MLRWLPFVMCLATKHGAWMEAQHIHSILVLVSEACSWHGHALCTMVNAQLLLACALNFLFVPRSETETEQPSVITSDADDDNFNAALSGVAKGIMYASPAMLTPLVNAGRQSNANNALPFKVAQMGNGSGDDQRLVMSTRSTSAVVCSRSSSRTLLLQDRNMDMLSGEAFEVFVDQAEENEKLRLELLAAQAMIYMSRVIDRFKCII